MTYTVRYLAMDSEVRWCEVEAESSEEAVSKVRDQDAECNYSSDSIWKIIDVE